MVVFCRTVAARALSRGLYEEKNGIIQLFNEKQKNGFVIWGKVTKDRCVLSYFLTFRPGLHWMQRANV